MREWILAKQARIRANEADGYRISEECVDFVNKLLIRKPGKRLGARGSEEVKNHPWLRGFNWTELELGIMKSPYRSKVSI